MHDLINDLATSVAGEFFFRLDDKMGKESLEKFRHFSFIGQTYEVYRKFEALHRARRLRTFLPVPVTIWRWSYFSNKVLVELLPQLQFLRVLNLSGYLIRDVPQSIGRLKHMRYLNFSCTAIKQLPEQVCDLFNLQSLLVSGCFNLSSLPNGFAKLINLRHLDISGTLGLEKIPLGCGGLTCLQTLSKVIIEGTNGFKISELKGLLHLRGQIYIKGLHNVRNGMEAKEANLQQKKGLDDLEMEWRDDLDDSRNKINEFEVLEGLRPHCNLRKLEISFYGGTKFPIWIGDISFDRLKELTLRGCRSCPNLPTLGHLRSLRKLSVKSMNGVKTLDSELLGPTNSCSLEVLKFEDMEGWEKWTTSGGDHDESFPCLGEIFIKDCPKLDEVSIGLIPSLGVLHIEGCCEAVLRSMVGASSSIDKLRIENIKGLTQLHGEVLKHLGAVEDVYIGDCDELRYLWESEYEACKSLVGLRKLEVSGCKMLVSLGEKEVGMGISMKSVGEVSLRHCERLNSYDCPNTIERLDIWDCPSMTSLTFPTTDEDLPSTLKVLEINGCDNLEEGWVLNNFLSSLEFLTWSTAPRLFPAGCFVHLTTLIIWNCDSIESIPEEGLGFVPLFCLRFLRISSCKNLKSFPHEHLPSLTSFEDLGIHDCPSIDYSFPCGLRPPNLRRLEIGGLNKPKSEWGMQNYPTSLVTLRLNGKNSGVVSFADARNSSSGNTTTPSFLVPPSLTYLSIRDFDELESVSRGLQHLSCLQHLYIKSCPKPRDLPEKLLPSLSSLDVENCTKVEKMCRRRKGKYWPVSPKSLTILFRIHDGKTPWNQ